MVETKRWGHICTVAVLLLAAPACAASPYKGFTKLDAKDCVPADDTTLSKLPPPWKAYGRFAKACNLKKRGAAPSSVTIISIWEQEYFKAVAASGDVPRLQSFPHPVLVDNALAILGTLPEVYPDDDITSSTVYYGKWQQGIPTEILVDVENPAEGGDYFYEPIRYSSKFQRYEMSKKEIVHGRRR